MPIDVNQLAAFTKCSRDAILAEELAALAYMAYRANERGVTHLVFEPSEQGTFLALYHQTYRGPDPDREVADLDAEYIDEAQAASRIYITYPSDDINHDLSETGALTRTVDPITGRGNDNYWTFDVAAFLASDHYKYVTH